MSLITTTVSIDAEKSGAQVVVHLIRGDYNTRTLQLVPLSGGSVMDITDAAQAKVRAHGVNLNNDLVLNCAMEDGKIFMVPTQALTSVADDYACQLVLLDDSQQTLSSMPFTVIVHGDVFTGDTVEHTNTTVTNVYFDEDGQLMIELMDGTKLVAERWLHTHDLASALAPGFMSTEQFQLLQDVAQWLDQGVKTTDSPTFAGLTVGDVTINGDGTIDGLRFT